MGRIVLGDKRICCKCGSDKTYRHWKLGTYYWHRATDGWMCSKCYDRIKAVKYRKRASVRQFRFGGWRGHFYSPKRMLTGYCSKCSNNVFDGSCKQTSMHHWYYLRIAPMCCRQELCQSCHAKLFPFWQLAPVSPRHPRTGRFVRLET